MNLNEIKNSTFRRIGNSYPSYFDPNHFMGTSSLDFNLTPAKVEQKSRNQEMVLDNQKL